MLLEEFEQYELLERYNQKFENSIQKKDGFEFLAFIENRIGEKLVLSGETYYVVMHFYFVYLKLELENKQTTYIYERLYKTLAKELIKQKEVNLYKFLKAQNQSPALIDYESISDFKSLFAILENCIKYVYDYDIYLRLVKAFIYKKNFADFIEYINAYDRKNKRIIYSLYQNYLDEIRYNKEDYNNVL